MKKIILFLPLFCFSCASERTLTKDEAIKYVNENYTSKVELTPKTLIKFTTIKFNNEEAKDRIKLLAHYGYDIELNDALKGEKKLNTKEEFLEFYECPLLPLNEQKILDFTGELTFKLIDNEMQITSFIDEEGVKEMKIFHYLKDGYEKTHLENFVCDKADYKYSVIVTTTFTY